MAIFNDVRDIERTSGRSKPFQKTTGLRKYGLAMLGYKDDGTRNTWGKINPMSYTGSVPQHLWASALAEGDSKKVIQENTSEAIGTQIGAAKLASNFIPGLGVLGSIGLGTGLNTLGNSISKSKGQSDGLAKETVGELLRENDIDTARKSLNDNVDSISDSIIDSDELIDEIDYTTMDDALIDSDAAANLVTDRGSEVLSGGEGVAKGAKLGSVLGKAGFGISVLGDTAGVIQSKMSYDKGLEKSKRKIRQGSLIKPSKQNYL